MGASSLSSGCVPEQSNRNDGAQPGALDECGRVLDARVAKSSKTKVLDEAALAAARTWVLEQPTADKLVDGRFETPVDLNLQDDVTPTPSGMGWPSSHKRPRYVLEPLSNDLALIEPVQTARREERSGVIRRHIQASPAAS